MEFKYWDREVTITKKAISVYFPDGDIFLSRTMPYKNLKLKDIHKLVKLFVMKYSYLQGEFMRS